MAETPVCSAAAGPAATVATVRLAAMAAAAGYCMATAVSVGRAVLRFQALMAGLPAWEARVAAL
ncbi:hypothetical protein LAUMK191_02442 [Mycobacterium attenuatum]|nr:hypothetical protein LAUMK191_02442 [Mycobacterium attenuatum]